MLREKQRPKFEDSGMSLSEYIDTYYLTEFEDLVRNKKKVLFYFYILLLLFY